MVDEKSSIEYKLVLLGDSAVGKTCLFKKITKGTFSEKNISTIGMDKKTFQIEIDVSEDKKPQQKKLITICLLDTAGQEKFHTITKTYLKGANGVILMYDLTNKESFNSIEEWVNSISEINGKVNDPDSEYLIFLLGNKLDLITNGEKKREVTTEEGQQKSENQGITWGGECSVKEFSTDQFNEMIKDYVKKLYNKIGEKKDDKQKSKRLDSYKPRRRVRSCCLI